MYKCIFDQGVANWHIYKHSKTSKFPGKHENGIYVCLDACYNYLLCGLVLLWQFSEPFQAPPAVDWQKHHRASL
jgi:hypothetical protein